MSSATFTPSLRYVGPKPLISESGVSFDQRKEDKYLFLPFVVELIKALDHEYIDGKRYTYITSSHILSAEALWQFLAMHINALSESVAQRLQETSSLIDDEIAHAREHPLLVPEEQEALINNLTLLRPYRLQRSINKCVYYAGITFLASIIRRGHIDYINVPIDFIHFHVLRSLQGALERFKIDTALSYLPHGEELYIQLCINGACQSSEHSVPMFQGSS